MGPLSGLRRVTLLASLLHEHYVPSQCLRPRFLHVLQRQRQRSAEGNVVTAYEFFFLCVHGFMCVVHAAQVA